MNGANCRLKNYESQVGWNGILIFRKKCFWNSKPDIQSETISNKWGKSERNSCHFDSWWQQEEYPVK